MATSARTATIAAIRRSIRAVRDPERAAAARRFFKTGPGDYGEGDVFCGVPVPTARRIAREHSTLPLAAVVSLLHSRIHEERFIALVLLIERYRAGSERDKSNIYRLYLNNTDWVNNWDLVDVSAPNIVGAHLAHRSRAPLRRLARSNHLWERRIAIVSTFHFITHLGESAETFAVADLLLHDRHDLIQKSVGWMLREVGKRVSRAEEQAFLNDRYEAMGRTALRYAIEQFPESQRAAYLKGTIERQPAPTYASSLRRGRH